jgi:uncharacterized protein with von Willebrand factor type A (vWA) domain
VRKITIFSGVVCSLGASTSQPKYNPFSVQSRSLVSNVARFADLLKREGADISLGEVLDAIKALTKITLLEKELFYFCLRTSLVKRPEFYVKFDLLFRQFWSADRSPPEDPRAEFSQQLRSDSDENPELTQMESGEKGRVSWSWQKNTTIYSSVVKLSRHEFNPAFSPGQIGEIKRVLRRFKRKFATQAGRRYISSGIGKVDLARSIKKSVTRGGQAIFLEKSARKIARSKIIAFADVSGSMEELSDEIYLILYLLKNVSTNSEIFIFSTDVVRLTDLVSFNNFRDTAERISRNVRIWGSGTKIGECFQKFLANYGSLIDRDTIVVIISDGWDLGESEILRISMQTFKEKSRRIIWLNPHAKMEDYEPICIGMKTALPYIDVLTSPEVFTNKSMFEACFGKATSPSLKRKREE